MNLENIHFSDEFNLSLGARLYGDFATTNIIVKGLGEDFLKLAAMLDKNLVNSSNEGEFYISPSKEDGGLKRLEIVFWRSSAQRLKRAASFKKMKLKRFPWYPASEKWAPRDDLLSFGIDTTPYPVLCINKDGVSDVHKPYVIRVNGSKAALLRFKILLEKLGAPDSLVGCVILEGESGFRGVGVASYEVELLRNDPDFDGFGDRKNSTQHDDEARK